MKHRTTIALTAALLLCAGSAVADAALAIGASAPLADTAMKGTDGSDHTIAGSAGDKGTLVVFTCNHCPWAKAWEERIVALGNHAAAQGVGVIAINSNDPKAYEDDGFAEMQQRAKERGMNFPYVVDATSDVARAFGATRTPEAYLFDASGKLVYHGTIDDNAQEPEKVEKRYLADAVDAVVAGAAVPVAETKALGCGIKFRGEG